MSDGGEGNSRAEESHGVRQPQAPNVKPKLGQNDRNSKEEHRKKEKPSRVRRSRSSDSERTERGRRRESDRNHGERRHRGRSEEGRGRRRRESDRRRTKPPENDVEDTECAVCFCTYDNVFKTPPKAAGMPGGAELPHGRDLPRLGNNRDIISKLPPDMQRALSIRFKRSQGKLMLKNPPPNSPTRPNVVSLPTKSQDTQAAPSGNLQLSAMEQGITPTTVVDVGRPPNRVRGRLRRMFRSDQCYYAVVATIITITVALMLVGILAFVIVPTVSLSNNGGSGMFATSSG
uniref:Ring finger protein 183 n=1 Tax=Oreochromis niloticus TaxID=8128 RepID=A0A669CYZ8_ORENI